MLKILLSVLCTCLVKCCAAIDFKDLDKITYKSLDDWLQQVNDQYLQLNQLSASFAWDLMVDADSKLLGEASELGKYRAKWQNQRCAEARDMSTDGMTPEHRRMIWILCRGPKYTEYQGGELSKMLNRIQDIYTDTKVCLPKAFDVCVNYNRIWEYTYLKTPNEDLVELDLTNVVPRLAALEQNPLNYFDGNVTNDYYVFRGIKDLSSIPSELETDEKIRSSQPVCFDIENDLEKIMTGNFSSLQRPDCAMPQDVVMLWAWESWRLAVGPAIGEEYPSAVYMMNVGAHNNGYNDIGECWREELEIPDLESVTKQFWHKIKPYYQLLHGVLRNVLRKKYEHPGVLKEYGPIPAHLLGNMWSQDWSSYHKLLSPFSEVYIDDNFRKTNWSNLDMVNRAEDFYSSMGLSPMTEKFWKNSKFEKSSNSTKCHGSAGNMFTGDDYRMIVCAERSLNDFYVIVHEMGHIEYYMHVQKQPALFQDATNSAFGEAIGDAVFLGIVTPQHLNRLGLLNDRFLAPTKRLSTRETRVVHETKEMPEFVFAPKISKESFPKTFTINGRPYTDFDALNAKMDSFMQFKDAHDRSINAFDLSHLLRIALEKIPHIPFEFILDQWRWTFFKGDISKEDANDFFWKLSIEEQGIHPPNWVNRHKMFDVAAKYHLADNTPYVRYFLSSFLQVQIFKGLCEKTIFGKFNTGQKLPMPLHRCDIYGSKRAGRILKKALSLGSSVHWTEVLYILTGSRELSVEPLLEYYQPLFAWLEKLAIEYDVPIGW